jgi:hypothetical protein
VAAVEKVLLLWLLTLPSFFLVLAPLTVPDLVDFDWLLPFFFAGGSLMTFADPGVGLVVQYHLPLASDQLCPSLAVVYTSVIEVALPNGSSNLVWPPALLKLKPVSAE